MTVRHRPPSSDDSRGREAERDEDASVATPAADAEGDGFGSRLRGERRRRDLDLAYVQARTKIRFHYLVALEDEDLDRLPAPAFVRSYLRSYAACLGIDPSPVLADYERALGDPRRPGAGARAGDGIPPVPTVRRLAGVASVAATVLFAWMVARSGFFDTLRPADADAGVGRVTKKERIARLKRELRVDEASWEAEAAAARARYEAPAEPPSDLPVRAEPAAPDEAAGDPPLREPSDAQSS